MSSDHEEGAMTRGRLKKILESSPEHILKRDIRDMDKQTLEDAFFLCLEQLVTLKEENNKLKQDLRIAYSIYTRKTNGNRRPTPSASTKQTIRNIFSPPHTAKEIIRRITRMTPEMRGRRRTLRRNIK